MPRQFFQNSSRHFEAAFSGLVRIGGGADRDLFSRLYVPELLPQQIGGVLLDVDLLLEVHAIAHLHKFVGVAGITVLAGKFAAAIRIDRPGKRHAHAGAAVKQGTSREGEIFHVVALAKRFTLGREAGNTYKLGRGLGQQGKGSHIFRLFFAYRKSS